MTIQRIAKKFFGLFLLYCCIILGIFTIQFRNELLHTKKMGQLKVTLRKNNTAEQNSALKNNFQILYKGLLIFSDTLHPVVLSRTNGNQVNLTLTDYIENAQQDGFSLVFDSGVKLVFNDYENNQQSSLTMRVELPREGTALHVPYKVTGGFLVTEKKNETALFASKTANYLLSGTPLSDSEITFTRQKSVAHFDLYAPSMRFEYASIVNNPMAQATAYADAVAQFRAAFLAEISPTISSSMIERDIVAYIAEMAYNNTYKQAFAAVSSSFGSDSRRSFLSIPFFGNTAGLNTSLAMSITNRINQLQQTHTSRRLDVFATEQLGVFLLLNTNSEITRSVLRVPSELNPFQPTHAQAAGILDVYAYLKKHNYRDAALLEPVLPACLERVAESIYLEGNFLALKTEGEQSVLLQTVKTANALIRYGTMTNKSEVLAAGHFLFASLTASAKITGAQAYADIYPLAAANPYYPHITILSQTGNSPIWAWTTSPEITYSVNAEKTATITVHYYAGDAHYMIINGIEPFESIEMYGLRYRSDRQFEMYNSSGYVYLPSSKTLLLKVRNREEGERIRLFYSLPAAASPETPNTVQTEPATEQ